MYVKQLLKLFGLLLIISHQISGKEQDVLDENYCKKDNQELVKLSPYNQGDVYLMSQMMVALTAFEACVQEKPINLNTPIGYCASKLYVQNCNCLDDDNESIFLWNTVNGQLLLAMGMPDFRKYLLKFRSALISRGLSSAESTFNQLLGINGLHISEVSYEVYSDFGNIFARMVAIGGCSDAVALVNLDAFLLYASELPKIDCYLAVSTPLGCLANIQNIHVMVQEMSKASVILDGYAHWYNGFTFLDSLYPSKTKSDYIISHIIGAKKYIHHVKGAVRSLVKSLYGPDSGQLIVDILFAVALNNNNGNVEFNVLYKEPSECRSDRNKEEPDEKHLVHSSEEKQSFEDD